MAHLSYLPVGKCGCRFKGNSDLTLYQGLQGMFGNTYQSGPWSHSTRLKEGPLLPATPPLDAFFPLGLCVPRHPCFFSLDGLTDTWDKGQSGSY